MAVAEPQTKSLEDKLEELDEASFREWLLSMPRSERVGWVFGFEATDYQAEFLDYHEDVDKAQAAPKKGRQVGATLTAAVIGADRAMTHPGEDTLFAAPGQGTADEMFRECKEFFRQGPLTLQQYGVTDDNKRTWEFDNGHRILSRTLGNVDRDDRPGNRGMSPTGVLVDEAAYEKDKVYTDEIEGFFITHPAYEYYLFSTPAGKSGYFFDAVEGKNADRWFSPHWPTRISPFAQEDYIERKREELDSLTFAQEYQGEFAESEDAYLPHTIVKPCVDPDPASQCNALRYLGVDPAREGKDRMVLYDLDAQGVTRNIWSEEQTTGTGFVGRITALQQGTASDTPEYGAGDLPENGYEAIVIEENAVGGFGADLAEAGLGNVIRKVRTSSQSKQDMYQRLKKDLEDEALTLPNHRRLINQLTSLEYRYTQHGYLKIQHPTGGHDDYPDALALANAVRSGLVGNQQPDDLGW